MGLGLGLGLDWDGMGWDGMGWDGMGWDVNARAGAGADPPIRRALRAPMPCERTHAGRPPPPVPPSADGGRTGNQPRPVPPAPPPPPIHPTHLDEQVDLLQRDELVGAAAGNARDEVQGRVPPVHVLVLSLLDDVAHLGRPGEDVGGNVPQDPPLVALSVRREELGQPDLALPRHEHDEVPPYRGSAGVQVAVLVVGHGWGSAGWSPAGGAGGRMLVPAL